MEKLPTIPPRSGASRTLRRLGRIARKAGTETIYSGLLLYYAYEREDTPKWAKRSILGVLGYLLMPFDAIPDLTPILGYTDDLAVVGAGLATVALYINKDVRKQARGKVQQWLPQASEQELTEVDKQL